MHDSFFPTEREYSRRYGLNSARLSMLKPSAIVMHPGPMNRGLEISAESADDIKSVVIDQVKNGVSVRMAVLYELLGGVALGSEKSGGK
jgi:aspartate carbamoyltransferase catalytic subunit